ncbi:hypothetical protein HBO38_27100 [Pseudomonas veronii]|uniref:Uncharacterized protein n=1 Tax=Pseudomonas veronii TaxID=76761 RepID=A0A7Y1AA81_PSEVE|nr:hypothetical protein [Pseudomonas veronii]NMY12050.1 hypothetical protein [Pseudomonas veronii]
MAKLFTVAALKLRFSHQNARFEPQSPFFYKTIRPGPTQAMGKLRFLLNLEESGVDMNDFGEEAILAMAVRLHHGLSEIRGEDVPLFERFLQSKWATAEELSTGPRKSYTNAKLEPLAYNVLRLTTDMLVSKG